MYTVVPSQIVGYIDARYPQVVEDKPFYLGRDHAPAVAHLLTLVDSLPPGIVTLQGDALAEFGEAVEAARGAVSAWNAGDNHHELGLIPGRGKSNALVFLRRQLASLRDEVLAPTPTTLAFVTDSALREDLRLDIAAANRALGVADWKGCTVLAGSVVEALLLWALDTHEAKAPGTLAAAAQALVSSGVLNQKPSSDLLYWGLHELTEVAHELKIVSGPTAAQCRIARGFRNLIHPGKAARLAQRCTLGTALSALAAVEHVAADFS